MSESPNKTKHTPGPWMLTHTRFRLEVKTGPDRCYAFSHGDEANARLIAAAPELYQALKDIVFFGTVQGQRLANAKAAIAKAEGSDNV